MHFTSGEDPRRGYVDVAIIGAGPYGLSLAAHLNARKVRYRIFGKAMELWSTKMPPGMCLKSEGFASSLYEPSGKFTLENYCRREGLEYARVGYPVPLKTFLSYALEFQKTYVPSLEEQLVLNVESTAAGFRLQLEDGEVLCARKVVVAVGIHYYSNLPAGLASLGAEYVSHSSAFGPLDRMRGKRVAILGGGSSAADIAALLKGVAADVQMFVRASSIDLHTPPGPKRTISDRVFRPSSGIGAGVKIQFYVHAPQLFRLLPETVRLQKVKKILGPAVTWWVAQQLHGNVPIHLGAQIQSTTVEDGEIVLQWTDGNKQETQRFDHIIAATGYKVNLQRLGFLSPEIRNSLLTVESAPRLSSRFESSIPHLYFVGISAANTFGPMLRFAFGARFAARTLSGHLARVTRTTKEASDELVEAFGSRR